MKKRNLIITSLALLTGALAVTGLATLAGFESSKRNISIVGTDGMHGSTIFLSPGKWEDDAPASFYMYAWVSEVSEVWIAPKAKATGNGYYVFELDTKVYSNLMFARMNPEHATLSDFKADNENLWNKTEDLTFNANKRLYKITDWGEYGQKVSPGEWDTYTDS